MSKIEPIGIGGLHRGLSIPEIYIENTKLHDEVNGLRKQRRKAREKNNQLQSNWNSLKEWLEKNYNESHDIWYVKIINKMNELEGGVKE